jgi:hypothetical protein
VCDWNTVNGSTHQRRYSQVCRHILSIHINRIAHPSQVDRSSSVAVGSSETWPDILGNTTTTLSPLSPVPDAILRDYCFAHVHHAPLHPAYGHNQSTSCVPSMHEMVITSSHQHGCAQIRDTQRAEASQIAENHVNSATLCNSPQLSLSRWYEVARNQDRKRKPNSHWLFKPSSSSAFRPGPRNQS